MAQQVTAVRDWLGKESPLQATISYDFELNGNQSLSATILPSEVNKAFIADLTELWTIIDHFGVEQKIVFFQRKGKGKEQTVQIKGVPLFFDVLSTDRIYERYDEHMTAQLAFTRIFDGLPFVFVLADSFDAVEWEGFGDGESKLETFKRALDRYGAEFRIAGNTVYLHKLIGRDLQWQYRHRLNASNITLEHDASAMWTYAKGYGDYGDGEGSEDWQNAKLIREYTSPLAKIPGIGIRHAPPIKDGRIKIAKVMDENLKTLVDESLKISVSADIHDLREQGYPIAQPEVGDRVFLIDDRIGFDEEVRVVDLNLVLDWRGNVRDIRATFGTPGLSKRYQARVSAAVSAVNDLFEGKRRLPAVAVYDEAMRNAVNAIHNAQTELVFPVQGGIIAMDKIDPNKQVWYNAGGLMVSKDGGATAKAAITGEGVVTEMLTAGTINANRIAIMGGTPDNYTMIDGSLFISRKSDINFTKIQGAGLESRGQFTRTWRGTTETHDVSIRLENGYIRAANPSKERAISISDFGISTFADGDGGGSSSGTIEFFSRRYSDVNGLTLYSSGALGADASEIVMQSAYNMRLEANESQIYFRPNRTNRPGNNTFQMSVYNEAESHLTDGLFAYGSTNTGYTSGLRFSKRQGEPVVWVVGSDLSRYGDTKIGAGYFMGWMAMSHTGENFYIGSSVETRSVNSTAYQNGTISYIPHRAASFPTGSMAEYKQDIKAWDKSALELIRNTQIYEYRLKTEVELGKDRLRQGLVIGDGYHTPDGVIDGDGVEQYLMNTWSWRAIQELDEKLTAALKRIETLEGVA